MHALLRYPKHRRRAIAQEWARRSQAVQAEKRMERGVDAETLRKRALDEARGQIMREGVTYHGDGRVTQWCIRRSIAGRTNQLDIVANGRVWRTTGQRNVVRCLAL